MKRFILKGLLAAVILVGGAEATARWALPAWFGDGLAKLEDYYRPVEEVAATGPITHLAVGPSQVAAAIDADTLEALLRAAAPPAASARIRALNVGKGYSQPIQHYFGVRNLIERYPTSMEGVVVFVSAPGGVGDYRTWEDNWALPAWPSLLGPLLRTGDLPRFYLQADNTVADKVRVTAAHFLHTARYYRHIRMRLEAAVNKRLAPSPDEDEEVDLTAAGGIRTDRAGVELTRIEAMRERNERWVEAYGAGGRQASDWDQSVWADLVRIVRAHGGDVVFYDMPQSPIMAAVGDRARVFEERRQAFESWARANDLPVLYPQNFEYGVEDFPDHLHLRKSRSGEFTARLAEAYLAWERSRRAPPQGRPQ